MFEADRRSKKTRCGAMIGINETVVSAAVKLSRRILILKNEGNQLGADQRERRSDRASKHRVFAFGCLLKSVGADATQT